MRYRIKTHQDFDKEFKRLCKKYSSLKADLSALGKSLSENPDQGTSLGKGVRKVRMAIASKGKGKSHGARVITYTEAIVCADNEGTVILLTIYDKADRDSISAAEIDGTAEILTLGIIKSETVHNRCPITNQVFVIGQLFLRGDVRNQVVTFLARYLPP